jgi:hypothetical protein
VVACSAELIVPMVSQAVIRPRSFRNDTEKCRERDGPPRSQSTRTRAAAGRTTAYARATIRRYGVCRSVGAATHMDLYGGSRFCADTPVIAGCSTFAVSADRRPRAAGNADVGDAQSEAIATGLKSRPPREIGWLISCLDWTLSGGSSRTGVPRRQAARQLGIGRATGSSGGGLGSAAHVGARGGGDIVPTQDQVNGRGVLRAALRCHRHR